MLNNLIIPENILQVIFRTIAIYLFIVIAIRLFGKKELAQLSVIDLVFILLISNAVQNAMVGPDTSLLGGISAAGTLFVVNALLKFFIFKNKKFGDFLQGHAVMLIHEGKIIQENLDKEEISSEELEASVREHGLEHISDVNLAVLEVDGNISILSENYQRKTVKKRSRHKVIRKSY